MKNIYELIGLISAVNYDGVINELEVKKLQNWVDKNRNLTYDSKQTSIINLVDKILEDNIVTDEEKKTLFEAVEAYTSENNDVSAKIYELNGVVEGVICDNVVNEDEIIHLQQWMDYNREFVENNPDCIELCELIDDILKDGIVTEEEQEKLLEELRIIINKTQLETKISYLKKLVKSHTNIGIDLIDILDNQNAMDYIHGRAMAELNKELRSYTGGAMSEPEMLFISLCLIGMLNYDGSFYDSVRVVYKKIYDKYPSQKIENLIRYSLNKYRTAEEKTNNERYINVALRNSVVPVNYLGAFFDFIYDIYKLNFDWRLEGDLEDEFKFVFEGLRNSMLSDGDEIQDNVTQKTYKLIKTTKQLIANSTDISSVIKLGIIVIKLIDKYVWGKDYKIFNPYLKQGFEKWVSSIDGGVHAEAKEGGWYSKWEPSFVYFNDDVYLVTPVHKIRVNDYSSVHIQVLSNGNVIFDNHDIDIRSIISGYKICSSKIKMSSPLDSISYRILDGNKIIYDSKEKLYRRFIVFSNNGTEIDNNTDYKGTAIFCYKGNVDGLTINARKENYNITYRGVNYGDTFIINKTVFNFSALSKPGIFGEVYDNLYLREKNSNSIIKVYRDIKYLVFEGDKNSKLFTITVNGKTAKLSDYNVTVTEREGSNKYVVDLTLTKDDIYRLSVESEIKTVASFVFALDTLFEFKVDMLDDEVIEYQVGSALLPERIHNLEDVAHIDDSLISFAYKGGKYEYLVPWNLKLYRLGEGDWKVYKEDMWIGEIMPDSVLDILDMTIDSCYIYSATGQKLEEIVFEKRNNRRRAKIGFVQSYKGQHDSIFFALLSNEKVVDVIYCNIRCVMRDRTEITYDIVENKILINPWFFGKGNVCCDVKTQEGSVVAQFTQIENDSLLTVSGVETGVNYDIVFYEKVHGSLLKNKREMSRQTVSYCSAKDFIGKNIKVSEVSCVTDNVETRNKLDNVYIEVKAINPSGAFWGEIYVKSKIKEGFRSNVIKNVEVDFNSQIISNHMEIIVTAKGKNLTYDRQKRYITESKQFRGDDIEMYIAEFI